MPVNHNKENLLARQAINNFLNGKGEEGFLYVDLAKEILLNFAVSETMIEKFINNYYVKTGEYRNEDGFMKKVKP